MTKIHDSEEPNDDLNLDENFRVQYGATDLDNAQAVDNALLDEFTNIKAWAGVNGELVYWTRQGTAANVANIIGINRDQMTQLYGKFTQENRRVALFMVLAHEAGHLCQYRHFGIQETFKRPRKIIEAHADLLSGVWLGVRLANGAPDPIEAARQAALQLTGGNPALYPSAQQRAELVSRGRAALAGLASKDAMLMSAGGTSPVEALTKEDFLSLYDIAKQEPLG